jgi:signal transduction histidine kinase
MRPPSTTNLDTKPRASSPIAGICGPAGFTAFLDSLPAMVMLIDADRRIVFRNRALASFASQNALPFSEMEQVTCGLSCPINQKPCTMCELDSECPYHALVRAVDAASGGQSEATNASFITTRQEALDLRLHASFIPLIPSGKHVLICVEDITKASRHRLLEGLFFHDLLNTAGILHGMAQLIAADPACATELNHDLLSATEALVGQLRHQRLLIAADAEELDVILQPVSARTLLANVIQTYKHHPLSLERQIEIAPHTVDFIIKTDLTLMHRILGNLVKNALEASKPGEHIELGATCEPGLHLFWCHSPRPISRAQQRKLFLRSFSTKGAGRGLGTFSIKLLTERYLGGHVTVHSTPSTGTRFELAFPGPTLAHPGA